MSFQNIRAISLRDIHLQILDGAAFDGTNDTLRHLTIHNCSLNSVPREALKKVTSLTTLVLTAMPIQHLRNETFNEMSNIRTLTLKQNKIYSIERMAFEPLTQLIVLDLSGNPLKNVGGSQHLNTVLVLKVEHGFIEQLSYSNFPNVTSLRDLDLRNNSMVHLFSDIFRHSNMLSVKNDPIFKHVYPYKCPDIRTLQLGYNNLKLKSFNFYLFPTLRTLKLNQNKIKTLPDKVFSGLSELDTLDLTGNELTFIQKDILHPLSHLKRLFLSYNHIQQIENEAFLPMVELLQLHLTGNCLNSPTRELMTVPIFLYMFENPISCTCSLRWITHLNSSLIAPNFKFVPCPNTSYRFVFEYLDKTCNPSDVSTVKVPDSKEDPTQSIFLLDNGRIVIFAVAGLLLMAGTPFVVVWLFMKKLRRRNAETSNQEDQKF